MNKRSFYTAFFAIIVASGAAFAERMDRPVGIKIGERMTLKPYVGLSVAYDSNVDGITDGAEDVFWTVNPALNLEYKAENWLLLGNVFYQYNQYTKNDGRSLRSNHAYGEDLTYRWTDSLPGEKGWSLMLSEKYLKTNQLEDFTDSIGRAYGRDRQEFKFAGALQRRFGKGWHADLNANYYWLDYDSSNQQKSAYGLYGWERWGVGGEIGYAASQWTDILIAASYQGFDQDNRNNNAYARHADYGRSSGAKGWTVQGGLGSFATERITYRILGGWSRYQFDEGGENSDGFTYTVSGNWNISETWKTMVLFTSYYQPTEMEYGSSQRVDSLSWGIAHSMVQGKLHGTFDVAFYRRGKEYSAVDSYDYDLDQFKLRLGLTYVLNRYLQFFGTAEYMNSWCEQSDSPVGSLYEYDRFLLTLGLKFTY